MNNSIYLFAAFSITWGIIFVYVLSLQIRQRSLEIQIDKIKTTLENHPNR